MECRSGTQYGRTELIVIVLGDRFFAEECAAARERADQGQETNEEENKATLCKQTKKTLLLLGILFSSFLGFYLRSFGNYLPIVGVKTKKQ